MFNTKRDAKGRVERYKERLVAKGYNQREGIDFKETFSLVSTKDSLRIIMAQMTHLDSELHQMDVRTTFLNEDLVEDVYMYRPTGFKEVCKEYVLCKLHKSVYGLKQAFKLWYLKFDKVVITNGF